MSSEDSIVLTRSSKEKIIDAVKSQMLALLHIKVNPNSLAFRRITNLIGALKKDISFVLEYPYIDRHFRDTYYIYFSSKFKSLARDCIRVHIFDTKNFEGLEEEKKRKSYCGYFVLRPLKSHPLGRSFIAPKAFSDNNFVCTLAKEKATILGVDFEILGFPHVAQDSEVQVCAESALWSLMEYYGIKYREYKPVLPSTIIKNIEGITAERTLPSRGLYYLEISACLRENDYQPKVYDCKGEVVTAFRIINTYIESGIPIILAVGNNTVGHAVLVIGHEKKVFEFDQLDKAVTDIALFKRKIVSIDDNREPYCLIDLEDPTPYSPLKGSSIQHFIVPLPRHVYFDAQRVIGFLDSMFDKVIKPNERFLSRLYLTSANSFKSVIRKDDTVPHATKIYLLTMKLPHFIWVCEIYDPSEYPQGDTDGLCKGLILLDATGGLDEGSSAVLAYIKGGSGSFKMKTYRHNLIGG